MEITSMSGVFYFLYSGDIKKNKDQGREKA